MFSLIMKSSKYVYYEELAIKKITKLIFYKAKVKF